MKKSIYTELFSPHYIRSFKVDRMLYSGRTSFQKIDCFFNLLMGKMLFLDEKIQSAQVDEFIYHEALVHPIMAVHPEPADILVIGGGEGAVLREVLKHRVAKRVLMVDIDPELVSICRKYLPEWSENAFEDPKVSVRFEDAREFVDKTRKCFDVIISDLTEPVAGGPSIHLFTREFFMGLSRILKDDGFFVMQSGTTDSNYNAFFTACSHTLEEVFPIVRAYTASIFSFGMPWGFLLASKGVDARDPGKDRIRERLRRRGVQNLKFYHPELHRPLFALPLYLKQALKDGGVVITDADPFIWTF